MAPVCIGIVVGAATSNALWVTVSQSLVTVVSLIAAGVLVRLARGVPFSAIDALSAEDARRLAKAIKQSVRVLRALLLVCFVTITYLVFFDQISTALSLTTMAEWLPFTNTVDYSAGLLVALLVFMLMRTWAVIDGDIQIADIQADLLVRKRGQEKADEFEDKVARPASESFRNPSGYGTAP